MSALTASVRWRGPLVISLRWGLALGLACSLPLAGSESPAMTEDTDQHDRSLVGEELPRQLSYPVDDLRIGVTLAAVPNVRETVHTPTGSAHYVWNGHRATGGGPDMTYLVQMFPDTHFWRHLLVGSEVQYLYLNTTPTSYTAGNSTVANTAGEALTLQMLNLDALAGWTSQPHATSWGEIDYEALGVLGAGMLWGDTQGVSPGGQPSKARGFGSSINAGLRLGVVLEDDQWLTGLHLDLVYTSGHVNINLPGGDHSRLTEKRFAPAGTIELGYRF